MTRPHTSEGGTIGAETPGGLPKPVWSGSFRIFGVDIKCHVLDNGQRIIEAESVNALSAAMEDPQNVGNEGDAGMQAFARWQKGGS